MNVEEGSRKRMTHHGDEVTGDHGTIATPWNFRALRLKTSLTAIPIAFILSARFQLALKSLERLVVLLL